MKTVKQVFLSSTARDLEEYRQKVREAIGGIDGYECVAMEKWGARAWEASEFCVARIRECDLLVGLVGHFHGSCPPGSERSYTEIEYDASEPDKRLMFVAGERFPIPANLIEPDAARAKQRAFRDRVSQAQIRATFESSGDLVKEVLVAIRNWEGDTASRGVAALPGLMRGSGMMQGAVRDAVIRSQEKFEEASGNIELIASNKSIHDLLHRLQFQCQSQLMVELELQSLQPTANSFERLAMHETELRVITDSLRTLTARPSVGGAASNLWMRILEDAEDDLHAAVEHADPQRLKGAIEKLNRVLSSEPSRINTIMNTTVKSLKLHGLVEVLERVREQLTAAGADSTQVKTFDAGVNELRRLSDRLTSLTEAHDRWQVIETELRRVDALWDRGVRDLHDAWPGLSKTLEPLLGQDEKFAALAHRLGEALGGNDDKIVRDTFRPFRSTAGLLFNRTDLDLNNLCYELRKLSKPLNAVMDTLR